MLGALPTPFLGRQRELAQLVAWSREATEGQPRIVLVSGAAGIGKSRLIDELAAHLSSEMFLLRGRCQEEVSIPYLALSNALAPIVDDWEPTHPRGDELERGNEQLYLYARVSSALQSAADSGPLALVLDDVQWADPASIGLLGHLITTAVIDSQRAATPQLFVLAHRPAIADRHVERTLARLRREDHVREVELGALDRAEIHALIAVIGGAPPSRKLLHAIEESSGGNPLMIAWLLRRLEDFGALRSSRGMIVHTSEGELVGLPADLDTLLRERSAAVGQRCRSLLVSAALFGDDELLADLETVTGFDTTQFSALLYEAVDSGLLVEEGDHYHFSHPQLRQLHFHTQRGRRRRQHHRQIADRLETAHPDDPSYALPIAHHLRMAGDEGDAARLTRYGVAAAAHAAGLGAWNEAWQLYEAVLDATKGESTSPSGFRALLEYRAALAAWWAHDNASARDHALRAVEQARALGDVERWGLAAIMATRATLGLNAVGTPIDTESIDAFIAAAGDGFEAVRARAHVALIEAKVFEDRSDLAVAHGTAAWELAASIGDETLQREVAYGIGAVHFGLLDVRDAAEWYERVAVTRDRDDDLLVGVWGTSRAGYMRLLRGDLGGAEERLTWASERARQIGAHAEHAFAACGLVSLAVVRGDDAEVDARGTEAELLIRLGDNQQAALLLYQALAASRVQRGDRDGAHAAITAYRSYGAPGRHLHALVNAITGHLDEARANLGVGEPRPVDRVGLWNANVVAADLELGLLLDDDRLIRCNYAAIADAHERGLVIGSGWPHDIANLLRRAESGLIR